MAPFHPLRFAAGELLLLDQRRLPGREEWLRCTQPADVVDAIATLAVRGAPLIGVAAAYGLALLASAPDGHDRFEAEAERLAATRPTAVNLRWAVDRMRAAFRADGLTSLPDVARAIHADQIDADARTAAAGAALFAPATRVLTHCNAGALATGGVGSALGVIGAAHAAGRVQSVWVDETRPLLQGARLTAWELARAGIPHRLVTDSMVGSLMSRGLVDRVVVGADRIAANGDVANKIGTYVVAVLAARHGVPFHVAAPRSTIDPHTATGADIPIEERSADEVTAVLGAVTIAPDVTGAHNPAFDVTPAELVTSIICETGVLTPPFAPAIARALGT